LAAGSVAGVAGDTLLGGGGVDAVATSTATTSVLDSVIASGATDSLTSVGTELASSSAATTIGEATDALVGGTGELLSSVGDAVATAVVASGTDLAINGMVGFGVWTAFTKWLVSGGAVAVAVEIFFAIVAIAVATKGSSKSEVESEMIKANTEEYNDKVVSSPSISSILAIEEIATGESPEFNTDTTTAKKTTNFVSEEHNSIDNNTEDGNDKYY